MWLVPNPEVLSHDWLPPLPIARERELRAVLDRLEGDAEAPGVPAPLAVRGPSGSGTSTVARRAARERVEQLRRAGADPAPRLLQLRTAGLSGPHGVATALLRLLDDGFDGRGFPLAEVVAGVLRRLRRERRPFVLVLDDVMLGGPELAPIARALAAPDRFLPEGESGLPAGRLIVAGTVEGLAGALRDRRGPPGVERSVDLAPYPPDALAALVRDRAERALGRAPPPELVDRTVARAVEDGGGARRAIELLRRELLQGLRPRGGGFLPGDRSPAIRIEPWVVDAIGSASRGACARVGDVRRLEAELARRRGTEPLPTTTLWRRIVRLEQAGYVRREIRPGGSGGTRSVVRVLTPVEEWITAPTVPQTRRAVAGLAVGPSAPAAGPVSRWPGWGPVPTD